MARELSVGGGTRLVITGDASAPSTCKMEYSVLLADGVNNDLKEDPTEHVEETPNFNQTVNLLGSGIGTTVKAAESIV